MEVSGELHAHFTGGWVGPRAGLDTVEKRKVFCPFRESNPGRPARSPSLRRLSNASSQIYSSEKEDWEGQEENGDINSNLVSEQKHENTCQMLVLRALAQSAALFQTA
jgi:hypothetical protein